MKKRSILVVMLIVVAVIACACLVACDPKNPDNAGNQGGTEVDITRPDEFIKVWNESKSKAIRTQVGPYNVVTAVDENIVMQRVVGQAEIIFETVADKVNYYIYQNYNNEWSAEIMTKEEAEKNDAYVNIKLNLSSGAGMNFQDFDKNFKKDSEGWWTYENNGIVKKMKVDGKELNYKIISGNATQEMAYILDYKIEIPQEAKDALNKN